MTEEQTIASSLIWQPEITAIQLIAGAGSGKTTTLIETVHNGISSGFPADKICLITFTRKAAAEMNHRLNDRNISPGFTGTMHSLGYSIITSYFRQKGLKPPGILRDRSTVFKDSVKEVLSDFSHIPISVLANPGALPPEKLEMVMNNYSLRKTDLNVIDLDDLITMAADILLKSPSIFPYRYLLVDEFQDTSPDQLYFIKQMRPEKIFTVGDDWQSIYSFRGADVSVTIDFAKHFKNSRRLFLSRNFRSQKAIVNLGNNAIKLSSSFINKKLRAVYKKGRKPVCHIANFSGSIESIWKSFLSSPLSPCLKNLTVLVRTNFIRLKLTEIAGPDIQILTVHSSKGMEFDNVLIFGIAKDIFPHRWNDFNEEVRLFYVAITRAKYNLQFLSWEENNNYSVFMPFLARHCKINYLREFVRDPEQTA